MASASSTTSSAALLFISSTVRLTNSEPATQAVLLPSPITLVHSRCRQNVLHQSLQGSVCLIASAFKQSPLVRTWSCPCHLHLPRLQSSAACSTQMPLSKALDTTTHDHRMRGKMCPMLLMLLLMPWGTGHVERPHTGTGRQRWARKMEIGQGVLLTMRYSRVGQPLMDMP